MATATKDRAKTTTPQAQARRAAARLDLAANDTRLAVLLILADDGPQDVTTLAEMVNSISQPAVSHHLALLRHGRLVEPRRDGKRNVYSLTDAGRELAEMVGRLAR